MRPNIAFITSLCLLVVTSVAQAQSQEDPAERPQKPQRQQNQAPPLTPEQLEAAWKLQATGFAHGSKLSDEQAEKVTEAYLDARKNYAKAQRDMQRGEDGEDGDGDRGGRGGRGGRRGGGFNPALRELLTEHREKLHDTLDDIMTDKTLQHAMLTLGAFDTSWDRMVVAITGFELGDDKTLEALKPVENYVAAIEATRESGNNQRMRQGMMDARFKLADDMKTILSEVQRKKFSQIVDSGFRRRRVTPGGPGGAGGRGGRGGGDRGGRGGGG